MHNELCQEAILKKESVNSYFIMLRKLAQPFSSDFLTVRHQYSRYHENSSTKPSKILDFSNMTRLWEVIKNFLGRAEKKKVPSLRIYGPRSFDWRYFQLHRTTPSRSKMSLNIRNFGNFRIWRPGPPYVQRPLQIY